MARHNDVCNLSRHLFLVEFASLRLEGKQYLRLLGLDGKTFYWLKAILLASIVALETFQRQ